MQVLGLAPVLRVNTVGSCCDSITCCAEMPSREVLQTALQWDPIPLPVPNFGYACLNLELRYQKPPIFTNR